MITGLKGYGCAVRWSPMRAATLLALVLAPAGVEAQTTTERTSPDLPIVWGGNFLVTLQSDQTLNQQGDVGRYNNTYSEPELSWYANVGRYFSLNGVAKMEQVRTVSHTGWLQSEGAWIDELCATVSFDPVRVYGGKIHPTFGKAWDATPGVYGTDFAEDYELTEKIGLGAAVDLPVPGRHVATAEVFHSDTSLLSNSAVTRPQSDDPRVIRPGKLSGNDGGVGNTGELDNYAASLSGERIPGMRGFAYNVGWALQRGTNIGGEMGEHSYVAGAEWEYPLTGRVTVTPRLEWARVDNQGGADIRADYYTAAVGVEFGLGWSAAIHGTRRRIHDSDAPDEYYDHLYGATIGYDLGSLLKRDVPLLKGLTLEAGYKHERVVREGLNTVGLLLTYARSF